MMMRNFRNKESGQAIVEFALVFPLFLMLVFAIIDFGWMGYQGILFRSAYQITVWNFPLKLEKSSGAAVTDLDIISMSPIPSYGNDDMVVPKKGGGFLSLGNGIRESMVNSTSGLLSSASLTVDHADADFYIVPVMENYKAGGKTVSVESYELRTKWRADLKYDVSVLTPLGKVLYPGGKKTFHRQVKQERTERVAVKRQVIIH